MSGITLRSWTCPLAITLLVLLFSLLPDAWQGVLQYRRDEILSGELWRLLSAHLTHLNWPHLLMNLVGLWLIWLLFLSREKALATCLFVWPLLMLGTGLGLLALHSEIAWYRGLSGALHGLLLLALLRQRAWQNLSGGLLLVLFCAKLLWEQTVGPASGSESLIDGRVIVESHLYGALSGGLIWLLERSRHHLTKREATG
jgi:rhomboid family GlyGly-CTERM serine protease